MKNGRETGANPKNFQTAMRCFSCCSGPCQNSSKSCGLSSAKLWMMWEFFANPGLKVSEFARALTIHVSTCSNMLDQLEDKGLVRRDHSKVDQRVVRLYLTEKGTALLADAPRPAQGTMSEGLERLYDDHLCLLEEGLDRLIEAMHVESDKAGMEPIDGR